MHCPNCGQQQISEETKFCSRCGMPLGLVAELLAHGGFLPQLAELYKGKRSWFTRKNGVVFSVIWFIFWVMMVPAFMGIAGGEEPAAVSAVFGLFTTVMLLIISLAFLKKTPQPITNALPSGIANSTSGPLNEAAERGALPPQRSMPVNAYAPPAGGWRTPDTGEIAHPSSITESTTKLLKKEEDQ